MAYKKIGWLRSSGHKMRVYRRGRKNYVKIGSEYYWLNKPMQITKR